ncbi:hypothetical protein XAC3810_130031 [Xanthomonas citri pv. citri]|uniref:Uncharacterized protein n=1 Tax=Xanthomonas citri pv. citri TaxID=611301 RepID=A0A0U5F893_XANCI|nr:hypothetical protein XAC3824_130030 [Xanthomonas citri pv. citri]CEE17452.1 hypothetical protein XAC9322_130028 [Xanthomonas citri pv. citri]CEE18510.1 hypothetical protein XAC1083_140030 [Xanthomonas citri pv. citri]CEE24382.1 hypothetical protein XAC902_140029 [Xanthomonas citri pv. citri]CEE25035.1 hypothetical protein XAC3810_130031 [Xanthomonas citri pv. citri]
MDGCDASQPKTVGAPPGAMWRYREGARARVRYYNVSVAQSSVARGFETRQRRAEAVR